MLLAAIPPSGWAGAAAQRIRVMPGAALQAAVAERARPVGQVGVLSDRAQCGSARAEQPRAGSAAWRPLLSLPASVSRFGEPAGWMGPAVRAHDHGERS